MNNPRRYAAPYLTIALASFLIGLLLFTWRTIARAEGPNGLYEMEVLGVAASQRGNQPVVLLRSKEGNRELTLFVGPSEAQSIAVPLQQRKPPRPLTHDLTLSLLSVFHARLQQVMISDFKENTYYATLYIETEGKEITVDSRPSDAIALALRVGVPIYANNKALDGAISNQLPR